MKNIFAPLLLVSTVIFSAHIYAEPTALLHKDFKERAFLSCLNLSDNLGVRSAELRKLI